MNNLEVVGLYKELLNTGSLLRIPTKGYSMTPFLKNGDYLIIKKTNPSEIIKGDIILFFDGQRLIAHRVIKKYKYNGNMVFRVKGDSTLYFDKPIYSKDILGKIIKIEKGLQIICLDNVAGKFINIIFAEISFYRSLLYFIFCFLKHKIHKILAVYREFCK